MERTSKKKYNETPQKTQERIQKPVHEDHLTSLTPSQLKKDNRTPEEKERDRLLAYKMRLKSLSKKLNIKYRTDKKFREKVRKTYRERYQNDPEYHKKTLERAKNRYHTDPEYRKATIERARKRRLKNQRNRKKN